MEEKRLIALTDCDCVYIYETDATDKQIEKAIKYKNRKLERDDNDDGLSDEEIIMDYLAKFNKDFNPLLTIDVGTGNVHDIKSFNW